MAKSTGQGFLNLVIYGVPIPTSLSLPASAARKEATGDAAFSTNSTGKQNNPAERNLSVSVFKGTRPKLKSQGIKREIKHLCKRLLSVASAKRHKPRAVLPRSDVFTAARNIFRFMGVPASSPGRRSRAPRAFAPAGMPTLLNRVVLSLPGAVCRGEAVVGRGFPLYVFDEKILERGTRKGEDEPAEPHPNRRVERFHKTLLDGPRPILNLARDDLEHQPQFC